MQKMSEKQKSVLGIALMSVLALGLAYFTWTKKSYSDEKNTEAEGVENTAADKVGKFGAGPLKKLKEKLAELQTKSDEWQRLAPDVRPDLPMPIADKAKLAEAYKNLLEFIQKTIDESELRISQKWNYTEPETDFSVKKKGVKVLPKTYLVHSFSLRLVGTTENFIKFINLLERCDTRLIRVKDFIMDASKPDGDGRFTMDINLEAYDYFPYQSPK